MAGQHAENRGSVAGRSERGGMIDVHAAGGRSRTGEGRGDLQSHLSILTRERKRSASGNGAFDIEVGSRAGEVAGAQVDSVAGHVDRAVARKTGGSAVHGNRLVKSA